MEAAILRQIIERRRSIYPQSYSGEIIEAEVLSEIVRSADFAPNHKKTKPWRLKVVRENDKRLLGEKLAQIYKETTSSQNFHEKKYSDILLKEKKSDVIIAICVNFSGLVPEWEEIAATAMAVQNMYLTSTAHGVGCYWSTPGMISYLGDFLNLTENQKCIGLFYMGKREQPL